MKIGYMRISTAEGQQKFDLQEDALLKAGVEAENIYSDKISGAKSERPGLNACLKSLRPGDVLVIYMLDRLARSQKQLVNIVQDLNDRGIGFKVLQGQGADIDTTTAGGKLIFGIFASLAEFERELIRERTRAGLAAARARGKNGGRRFALSKSQVRLAEAAMGKKGTCVADLCRELGIQRSTLYRYVSPDGQLRESGKRILGKS